MKLTDDQIARLKAALSMAQWGGPLTPDTAAHCLTVALSHEEEAPDGAEAPDMALFLALKTASRKSSIQEGVQHLRKEFRIYARR